MARSGDISPGLHLFAAEIGIMAARTIEDGETMFPRHIGDPRISSAIE
ncbi:MAG: hypothetical protein ACJ8E0_10920 [Sphingomicrobium sp.]